MLSLPCTVHRTPKQCAQYRVLNTGLYWNIYEGILTLETSTNEFIKNRGVKVNGKVL